RIRCMRHDRRGQRTRHAGRNGTGGGGSEAEDEAVDDLLPVESEIEGLPYDGIVEWRPAGVENHRVGEEERIVEDRERRAAPHEFRVGRLDSREVQLAR